MDFLVEMQMCVPPDYDPELLADLTRRERARAAEIAASSSFFKEVWIVPCQRARILICAAADATELHEVFTSLPAMKWSEFQVTPLLKCDIGSSICIPN
jgi:muconolactone delta-isomerase